MAIVAFIQDPFYAADLNSVPTDFNLRFQYSVFDSLTGVQFADSATCLVQVGDNATQIETKIRDAMLARALSQGWTVPISNVFMPSVRRG